MEMPIMSAAVFNSSISSVLVWKSMWLGSAYDQEEPLRPKHEHSLSGPALQAASNNS